MQVAVIENHLNQLTNTYKHKWLQLFYMLTSTISLAIEIYLRISVNDFYSSYNYQSIPVPVLNRYPTQFTASTTSISYIWYFVYTFQIISMIYSFIGVFRRTISGNYFYIHPCAMNELAYFYMTLAHLFYIPVLITSSNNTYYAPFIIYLYGITFLLVYFVFSIVNDQFDENLRDYLRDKFFLDVWLVQLIYLNGLAIWSSILFYETCLSIVITLIYMSTYSLIIIYSIGLFILSFGLLRIFFYEIEKHRYAITFILSQWLIFLWLLIDIFVYSNIKSNIFNIFSKFLFVILLLVIVRVIFYLICFYQAMKNKYLPNFHSGRVYSLIETPNIF